MPIVQITAKMKQPVLTQYHPAVLAVFPHGDWTRIRVGGDAIRFVVKMSERCNQFVSTPHEATYARFLVSLVSVMLEKSTQTVETVETVEIGEIVEIASIHGVPTHIAENMGGYSKRLGEYPTLSATPFIFLHLHHHGVCLARIPAN
jgi:hypothetical protein